MKAAEVGDAKSPLSGNPYPNHHHQEPTIITSVPKAPITSQHPLPSSLLSESIPHPSLARANLATSKETPGGSVPYSEKYGDYSVLQQHVLFWDRDGDGVIWPQDVYFGFRDLGFSVVFSCVAVLLMNLSFSYPTRLGSSWVPDPWFRIYVDYVHMLKHGSDSAVYDSEGRFVPQAFENIFSKYAKTEEGSLTLGEMFSLLRGNRCASDPFGWCTNFMEWITTWLLIQKDNRIYKEDLRQIYDGSIFWRIQESRTQKGGWDQGYGLGGDGFWGRRTGKIKL